MKFSVPIADITAAPSRITYDVTDLARSMAEIGLLQPILITPGLDLVAGWHRLEAARLLGWTEIDVIYVDELDAELARIDENLQRHELHYVERGDWLAQRKAIYTRRHPETEQGIAGALARWSKDAITDSVIASPAPSFVDDTSKRFKVSATVMRDEMRIATNSTPDLKTALVERDVPKSDALKLVKLPPEAQAVAAGHIRAGVKPDEALKEARKTIPRPPVQPVILPMPSSVTLDVADAARLPLPDCAVDLVVTSPPYGLDIEYETTIDPSESWVYLMGVWLAEMYRVTRPGGRLALNVPLDTTLGGYRPTWPQACHAATCAGWEFQHTIIWNEGNVNKSVARGSVDSPAAPRIIAPVEIVGVFSKGEWSRKSTTPPDLTHDEWLEWTNGLWTFPGESRAWEGHPAPFPAELPRRLIKLLSFPGDTVLDPFVGSGTSAVVATKLGRRVYGYDISETYVESARRRVAAQQEVAA